MGIMKRAYEEGWRYVDTPDGRIMRQTKKPPNRKVQDAMAKYRDRQRAAIAASEGDRVVTDGNFHARSPALFEFLTDPVPDSRGNPTTATLTCFAEDCGFKLCLNDRANGLLCFVWGETFQIAMEEMEKALQAGTADWRMPKGQPKKKG